MKAFIASISLLLMTSLAFGQLFINEIDYDQPDADNAEFIELAGPAGTYSDVSLEHYNGNGGALIWSQAIPSFTLSDESNGFGFYLIGDNTMPNFDFALPGAVQNGAPDGLVLKINGTIIDAVSWEGTMTIGGVETEDAGEDYQTADEEPMSVSRIGMDGSSWEETAITPGMVNTNQIIDPSGNLPPVANPGSNQIVEGAEVVTLDGSGSIDSDGSIVSYLWEQVSGTTVTLTNANSAIASFVAPTVTETSSWVFSLTVTDDDDATGTNAVTVTVPIISSIAEARTQDLGSVITVSGFINSVNLSSSGTDYTFQDATGGLDLYMPSTPLNFSLGDEITVIGILTDYADKLEIMPGDTSQVVLNSTGNPPPEAQVITVAEFLSNGEDYESELIRINGLSFVEGNDSWPTATGNANLNMTDNGTDITVMRIDDETEIDGTSEPLWPQDVIGVGSHNNGVYQITPRLLSDFVSNIIRPIFANETHSPEFATSASEITVTIDIAPGDETQSINSAVIMYGSDGTLLNESEMWLDNGNTWMGIIEAQAPNTFLEYEIIATAFTNYDGVIDTSDFDSWTYELAIASDVLTGIASIHANPVNGDVVTIEGIITIGTGLLQEGNTKAYIQDTSERGLQLFSWDTDIVLNRGDRVQAVGVVELFQTTLEVKDFSYQILSTGNELPAPVVLTPGEANEEIWEGTLVKIAGTITDTWFAGYGTNVKVGDGSDTTLVRIWETTGVDTSVLDIGEEYSFMGVGSQYNGGFQMVLAYDADILSTSAIDVIDTKPSQFALNPAYPNPFNPSTTLSWKLESASEMTLRVMDIRGREVARLVEGSSGPGQFSMSWDASALSSGVYFIQLNTPTESAIQKVMLLK